MAKRFHKHLSVLVIPDDGSRTIEFKLNYLILWVIMGVLGGLVVLVLLGGVFLGQAQYWKKIAQELSVDNARLRQEAERVDELAQMVSRMKSHDQKLRMMLSPNVALPPASYTPPPENTNQVVSGGGVQGQSSEWNALWVPSIAPISLAVGYVTREFESKQGLFQNRHTGIDIAAPEGTPVQAAANGKVVFAGVDDVFGNVVAIDHGGIYMTRYGHNSVLLVSVGEEVRGGQHISLVGNSGQSSGPHLHYEVIEDGRLRDPRMFLPQ